MIWRKTTQALIIACLVMVHYAASGAEPGSNAPSRLRLTFAGKEALVTVFDHPTSRDLLSRLPLTLEFRDYVGAEKIGYLEEKFFSDGTSPVETGISPIMRRGGIWRYSTKEAAGRPVDSLSSEG